MDNTVPSSPPDKGAIPYPGGTAFRVWAPFADEVWVLGTFNDWSKTAHPLLHEGHGHCFADVPNANPGQAYKFLIRNGAKMLERIDPYAREVTSSTGCSVIHDPEFYWGPDTGYRTPLWREMVIYEMHIGTFNDQPGGAPGNLNGVIEKLPYLKDLGINAIQIMPPMEFAGGFSWGYNPAYIFAIESDYGGARALKELVKASHAHGIAVIFDVVYNHFGPSDLDIWQFDGWSENNKGGIYFYNDWRSQTPWGDTRPDYGRDEVRLFVRDNVVMWLTEYRIDGLRWDATAYIRNVYGINNDPVHDIPDGWSLMQWINDEVDVHHPWKISIAEDLRNNPWLTKDTDVGGAGFDTQWDASFVHPVRGALIASHDHDRNMYAIRDAILFRYNGDAFQRVIYTESHDEVANGHSRLPEEIWPDHADSWASKKLSTLGAALVFTAPGIPMIFQGQEFLEDEWFRDVNPLDWSKKDRHSGIFGLYRELIYLRRNWYDNTRGLRGQHVRVHHVNNDDNVLAFHRWEHSGPRDDVVIVVNMANQSYDNYTIGFPRVGTWKVRFNSDWGGYDPEFSDTISYDTVAHRKPRDGMGCSASVGIGPYSVIILSQDE